MVSIVGLSATVLPMLSFVLEPVLKYMMNTISFIVETIFNIVANYVALPLFDYGFLEGTAYLACF